MEDDRAAHLADLAGDDLAQMQSRTQLRSRPEALDEAVGVRASAALIAKTQRNARASATPSASAQVMTISSPTYWWISPRHSSIGSATAANTAARK